MLSIEEISETHAVIEIDGLFARLSLEGDYEIVRDDDFHRAFTYKQYMPVIISMMGLDDDGEPYSLTDEQEKTVRNAVDCDEFYNEYQALFDDEKTYHESVSGWY